MPNVALWIDGEPAVGRALERDQAHHLYEDIVRRLRDLALLGHVDRGPVRASIFSVPADGRSHIQLDYTQVLTAERTPLHHRSPRKAERFATSPLEEVSVTVEVHYAAGREAAGRVAEDGMIVLDNSASMEGKKLRQAVDCALAHLDARDRFKPIAFDTGLERYAPGLRPATEVERARRWTALLAFGVGYDVVTLLLDSLTQQHHCTITYVSLDHRQSTRPSLPSTTRSAARCSSG